MRSNILMAILVMALVTYLIRVLPLLIFRKPITNKLFKSFLYYVPYVTLSVMTFPAIIYATRNPLSGIIAMIMAFITALKRPSLVEVALVACVSVYIVELFI